MVANKSSAEKHKDIARLDQPSKKTHGWYVRINFKGKTHSKFFSDAKHGGKELGLFNAMAWRNSTEQEIGKPRTDRHIVSVTKTQTGVVGVRLNEKLNRYEVTWVKLDGKPGKSSVSIRKHGKEKAFELACQIRQNYETQRLAMG